MNEDCKELSSKWVTESEVLTHNAAELIQILVVATTGSAQCRVYDGEDTQGELKLSFLVPYSANFIFPDRMYMRRGIYFYRDTKVRGALIRWKERPNQEG